VVARDRMPTPWQQRIFEVRFVRRLRQCVRVIFIQSGMHAIKYGKPFGQAAKQDQKALPLARNSSWCM
jgi:hypothetical protein